MNPSSSPTEPTEAPIVPAVPVARERPAIWFWLTRDSQDGPLPALLLVLTFVTGAVDAVSYLALGHVFVANMTGNIVFIGFALAGASGFSVGTSLTALAAFAAGSTLGGLFASWLSSHRGRLLAVAAAVQTAAVLAATVVTVFDHKETGVTEYALIVILAVTMGLQNAAARKLAVPDLTTTVLTLTTTGIFADARWLGGPGGRSLRRVASVVVMLAGALAGAVLLLRVSLSASLALALVLLASVTAASGWLSRGIPAWARPALRGSR